MPHFIFIQQIPVLNILNMLYNLHFSSSKCRLFHNATLFGFCITHILNTGCAKIWRKKIRRQKVKYSATCNQGMHYISRTQKFRALWWRVYTKIYFVLGLSSTEPQPFIRWRRLPSCSVRVHPRHIMDMTQVGTE
jgi:hypothetical protein